MGGKEFRDTCKQVLAGNTFGTCHPVIVEMLNGALHGNDPYLIGVDFAGYIKA